MFSFYGTQNYAALYYLEPVEQPILPLDIYRSNLILLPYTDRNLKLYFIFTLLGLQF
jgi:hypothetical protein